MSDAIVAKDRFAGQYHGSGGTGGVDWSLTRPLVVTPDDDNELPFVPRGLSVDADAVITITPLEVTAEDGRARPATDEDALALHFFKGWNPCRLKKIWETGTDAGVTIEAWD
jgi:hypothetical protein